MWQKLAVAAFVLTATMFCAAQRVAPKKEISKAAATDIPYSTVLLQTPEIAVRRLDIPPKTEAAAPASIHDYLLISLGNYSLSAKGDGTSFDFTLGPGGMQILDGGWNHALVNDSSADAQLFMIEPSHNIDAKSAICGLGKKTCEAHNFGESAQGTYNQYAQFETATATLYRMSLGAGVVTHLHSDKNKHLIFALTPFKGHIDAKSFELRAGGMEWVPSGFEELGNDGAGEARLLILELR